MTDQLRITRLQVKNWRNFKSLDLPLMSRTLIAGPNAVGKSNLLDAVRFLSEVAGPTGGLAAAIDKRGGVGRVRYLNARNHNHGRVLLAITLGDDVSVDRWRYQIEFTRESAGTRRPVVFSEVVERDGERVVNRPDEADVRDRELLIQTALEQVARNHDFRTVNEFLARVRYLHLVPQLIRDPARVQPVPGDPFGSDFLDRVASATKHHRERSLRLIRDALRIAVPQLDSLDLERDVTGRPHLIARYKHWRPNAARQDERDFSDGTLRLIGLLWSLIDGQRSPGVVLLEEPELSLHGAIAARLPAMLAKAQSKGGSQVLLTSHSFDILTDEGLGLDEVVLLRPGDEGTTATRLTDDEEAVELVGSGALSVADIVRARTEPSSLDDLTAAI